MGTRRRWQGCAQSLLILLAAAPSASFSPNLSTAPAAAALFGRVQAQWRPHRAPPVAARRPGRMPAAFALASSNLRATSGAKEAVVEAGAGAEEDEAARAASALQAFRGFYKEQAICSGGDAEVGLGPRTTPLSSDLAVLRLLQPPPSSDSWSRETFLGHTFRGVQYYPPLLGDTSGRTLGVCRQGR